MNDKKPRLDQLVRERYGSAPISSLRRIADGELTAAECRAVVDYRSRGLKIDEFRQELQTLLKEYRERVSARDDYDDYDDVEQLRTPRIQAWYARHERRRDNINKIEKYDVAATAYDPDDLLKGWRHGFGCAINCQDGLLLLLERKENIRGWNGRYPQKSIEYVATLYSAKRDALKSLSFGRRGKWLEAIRKEWSLRFDLMSKTKAGKLVSAGRYDPALPDTKIKYRDDDWTIVSPLTVLAVQLLSLGTLWCTKTRKHATNYFNHGFVVAYYRGYRYAAISGKECKNAKNEDIAMPPPLRGKRIEEECEEEQYA